MFSFVHTSSHRLLVLKYSVFLIFNVDIAKEQCSLLFEWNMSEVDIREYCPSEQSGQRLTTNSVRDTKFNFCDSELISFRNTDFIVVDALYVP